jgi:structural maintenance of chromosome 1
MGRIKSIEIDNFKSYLGNHVVGPFDHNFTAVIGPNGAGKSNLMDAVSFVLGVHSRDLRGGVLQDLIYKMEGHDRPTAASVSLIFDTEADGANSDAIDSDIVFTRRVTMRGASSYSVNGTPVSVKDYVAELDRLGVVVKAKNFLVFQGDVTSIANQSPADLCKFFERISGSEEFKGEYDSLNAQKAASERRLEDIVQQRKAIAQEKKIIEKQKREAEEFHKKKLQHGDQRQQLVLWQLNHAVHRHKEAVAQQQASEGSREDLQAKIDALADTLRETSAELGSTKKALLKHTKAVQAGEHDVSARRLKVSEAQKQVAATTKEMADDTKLHKKFQRNAQDQEAKLEELRAHVAAVEEEREALDLELLKDAADDSSSKLNLSTAELTEYNELKAKATQRSATHMQKAADVTERLARLRKKLEDVERETADLQAQRKVELEEIERNQKTCTVARDRLADDENVLASVTDAIEAARDKLRENGASHTAVMGKIAAANEKLSALMDTRASSSHEEKKQRNLELLQRQFRGVCGRLADLVRPTQRRYNLAVSTVRTCVRAYVVSPAA